VNASAAPGVGVAGIGGETSVQALEQRVQWLEEKLDSILKRLDARGPERPE